MNNFLGQNVILFHLMWMSGPQGVWLEKIQAIQQI